jgi:hypothetical protein
MDTAQPPGTFLIKPDVIETWYGAALQTRHPTMRFPD